MDTITENFKELWQAKRREYDAMAKRFDAKQRFSYNNFFDDLEEELSARADWTEATFKEFVAKADSRWQKFALDTDA